MLTITAGTLELPVHQGSEAEWVPPEAQGATPWAHRVVRAGRSRRFSETDMITGTVALVVEEDAGDTENLTHGLVSGDSLTERWEVHPSDPLSARAVHVWEQRLSRGDWSVRTHAHAEMTATATHLHLKARLTAWDGAVQVFDRSYDEAVERRFV